MSTIKVNKIENTSTTAGGIEVDTDGHVKIDGQQLPTAGPLSNRNLIINGAMGIDQRNDSAAVTTNGSFVCDRFQVVHASNGAFSAQQIVEAPDDFKTSLKVTTTIADSSLTTNQQLNVRQLIEGFNTIPTNFGKASARTLALSFWVRSSLTGTFGGAIGNGADNRSYVFSYTIDSANTWEYKTVTIPGDTTGTWLINNGIGMRVTWSLGSGPSLSEDAGSWYGSVRRGVTGGVNLLGTLNATWQITGVQLEVGSKSTPFEHRSYGDELQRCDRYCQVYSFPNVYENIAFGGVTSSPSATITCMFRFRNGMRAAPSFLSSAVSHFRVNDFRGNDQDAIGLTPYSSGTAAIRINATKPTANMTAAYVGYINVSTAANGAARWTFSAEL